MLPNKKFTYQDAAAVCRKSGFLLVAPAVICTLGALVYSSRLPNVYQSEMLIQVVPQRVPDAYVRSTVTMRTEDRLNSLSQQVLSRTQLERLIVQMNLYPLER